MVSASSRKRGSVCNIYIIGQVVKVEGLGLFTFPFANNLHFTLSVRGVVRSKEGIGIEQQGKQADTVLSVFTNKLWWAWA